MLLIVEYAIIIFSSNWKHAINAAKSVVQLPQAISMYVAVVDSSIIPVSLYTSTTPAITSVEECINAEAPSGASIASSNQI